MSNDAVLYDVQDAVATITLNRPKALNALNMDLTEGLVAAIDRAATDPNARCVILTSSSEHFMAGGDLLMFRDWLDEGVEIAQAKLLDVFDAVHSTVKKIKTMDKPVVVSLPSVRPVILRIAPEPRFSSPPGLIVTSLLPGSVPITV